MLMQRKFELCCATQYIQNLWCTMSVVYVQFTAGCGNGSLEGVCHIMLIRLIRHFLFTADMSGAFNTNFDAREWHLCRCQSFKLFQQNLIFFSAAYNDVRCRTSSPN